MDVVISGGGMVGLTLGLALAQGGLKTLIVDAAPPATVLEPGFDGRVSALAYASVRMMRALGVWEGLKDHAQSIREILVTDGKIAAATSPFSLHFDSQEVGAEALGYIAENRHIRSSLYDAVARAADLELVAPASVKSVAMESSGAVVTLADGSQVAAALVIAADGRESRLRAEMGIHVIGWSYPQVGIVATVEHEKPHNGVAYEHFLPSGPFAILPMTGNRSSLVWTEAKTKAPALLALDEAGFNAELARRFGDHLGTTKVRRAALVLSAVLPPGARFREAALRRARRRGAWHPSHRRAGIESRPERRCRPGRSAAGCGPPGPRHRRAGYAQAL